MIHIVNSSCVDLCPCVPAMPCMQASPKKVEQRVLGDLIDKTMHAWG